ncbi:MAG: hypothetical protein ABR507_10440 [Actinomycetota bacterium]|nr:hypothetical protein [Actinomycetota bacterium]
MIADLIEGNLNSDPARARLLSGKSRRVTISANDVDANVMLTIGEGKVVVGEGVHPDPQLSITTDSATLLDLPQAKLMAGLPSITDPTGRAVVKKLLNGQLKVKGIARVGLLTRVQRLLSVV